MEIKEYSEKAAGGKGVSGADRLLIHVGKIMIRVVKRNL